MAKQGHSWTTEQARAWGVTARAAAARKRAERKAESELTAAALENPSLALPGQLSKLVSSVSSEIERCKARSWPDKAERWCKVLERLVRLERLVSTPPASKARNGAGASSVAAAIVPRLARSSAEEQNSAGEPTTNPGQVGAGPPPANLATSSDPDPEPLEHAPLD